MLDVALPPGPGRAERAGPARALLVRAGHLLPASLLGLVCVAAAGGTAAAHAGPRTSPPTSRTSPSPNLSSDRRSIQSLILQEEFTRVFSVLVELLRNRPAADSLLTSTTLELLSTLAQVAREAGEYDVAGRILDLALEAAPDVYASDDPGWARLLCGRGQVYRMDDRADLAAACLQRARQLLQRQTDPPARLLGQVMRAQASLLRSQNDPAAIPCYRDALRYFREDDPAPSFATADALTWLGWTLFNMGQPDSALVQLGNARAELSALGLRQHSRYGTVLNLLGNARALRGDWAGAADLYRQGTAIFARVRPRSLPGFPRRRVALDGYDALAMAELRLGHPAAAWRDAQQAAAPLGLDFAVLARWPQLEPDTYGAVQDARAELLRCLHRGEEAAEADLTTRWIALLDELDARARVGLLEGRFLAAHRPAPCTVEELQANLDDRTALVGWLELTVGMASPVQGSGPIIAGAWAYVVRRDRPLLWVPLWLAHDPQARARIRSPLESYITRFRTASSWPLRVDADRDLDADSRHWARIFFDPLLPQLDGIERLIVVQQSESLAQFPLEAFVLPDGHYLDDRFVVSYVPSPAVFLMGIQARSAWQRSAPMTVLAVGDPAFDPRRTALTPRDVEASALSVHNNRSVFGRERFELTDIPPLPFSHDELVRLGELYPGAVLLEGASASEAQLDRLSSSGELSGFDAIHIATHGLRSAQPELCGVALARTSDARQLQGDGFLQAREVLLGWQLHAHLLTLSGCMTAWGFGVGRGESLGLTQAALATGAHSVIGSVWMVDDLATSLLMRRFYTELAQEQVTAGGRTTTVAVARALRDAKHWLREYRDPQGRALFAHPIYWSGFVLVGLVEDLD